MFIQRIQGWLPARSEVPSRMAMSLMMHIDGRLTDEIYTNENLLETWLTFDTCRASPGKIHKETHNWHHKFQSKTVRRCHYLSWLAIKVLSAQSLENNEESHSLTRSVTERQERGHGGRCRDRTCGLSGVNRTFSRWTNRPSQPFQGNTTVAQNQSFWIVFELFTCSLARNMRASGKKIKNAVDVMTPCFYYNAARATKKFCDATRNLNH